MNSLFECYNCLYYVDLCVNASYVLIKLFRLWILTNAYPAAACAMTRMNIPNIGMYEHNINGAANPNNSQWYLIINCLLDDLLIDSSLSSSYRNSLPSQFIRLNNPSNNSSTKFLHDNSHVKNNNATFAACLLPVTNVMYKPSTHRMNLVLVELVNCDRVLSVDDSSIRLICNLYNE